MLNILSRGYLYKENRCAPIANKMYIKFWIQVLQMYIISQEFQIREEFYTSHGIYKAKFL